MLGMKTQVTAADLFRRHNELVAQKKAQALLEPPAPVKRAQAQRVRATRTAPTPLRNERLSRREEMATRNDHSPSNAFNRLLIEASRLTEAQGDFSWEELCAACFLADPATFGMAGFPQWPDGSKVKIRLAHGKHLRNYKFVEIASLGRYRATADGLKRAAKLLKQSKRAK